MGVDPLIAPLRLAEAEAAKRPATGGYNELPSDRRSATGACFELAADMLVMGAYGRSRLHELMLGGVT